MRFYKYHGTGNDFILLDNRQKNIVLNSDQIARLCDRHYGIGADGLMLLEAADNADFRMVYYNADGNESSMCGNGGRCITAFASQLGLINSTARFLAIDGLHLATINADNTISLNMQDVSNIMHYKDYAILDTGSPHYIAWVDNARDIDVVARGRSVRYSAAFQPGGINVNFVQRSTDGLYVRTYERGVEDETLSCGTGVTASAIAATLNGTGGYETLVQTPGGNLIVRFMKDTPSSAKQVVLSGPARFVFEGNIDVESS